MGAARKLNDIEKTAAKGQPRATKNLRWPTTKVDPADVVVRVLLIEEDPWTAANVRSSLRSADGIQFDIVHVDQVAQGVAYLCENRIDVVLLDIGQPDALGAQGFLGMSAQGWGAPVIVFTGYDNRHEGARAMMAGANDHWVKSDPDFRALLRSIRIVVRDRQSRPECKTLPVAANDACFSLA